MALGGHKMHKKMKKVKKVKKLNKHMKHGKVSGGAGWALTEGAVEDMTHDIGSLMGSL